MKPQIRIAAEEDIDDLVDVIRNSFQDVADRFGLTPHNSPTHPSNCRPEWIMREMNRGVAYYILEAGGKSAGCVALEKVNDEVCYLERLAVLPQEQRKGYGGSLVEHVLSRARLLNVHRVQIGIIADHQELHDWYEKFGFEDVERKSFPQLAFQVTFMCRWFL